MSELMKILKQIQERHGIHLEPASLVARPSSRVARTRVPDQNALPVESEDDAALWVPPGTVSTIQGVRIPDGMIYVGRRLTTVSGSGKEPALIDPGLKTTYNPHKTYSAYELFYQQDYAQPGYNRLTSEWRGWYLRWLASGRTGSPIPAAFLNLFFFGIERRLLARPELVQPAEQEALCKELIALSERYEDYRYNSFRYGVSRLLDFLRLRALFSGSAGQMPDPFVIADLPRQYMTLPVLLEVALSRLAEQKQPLPASFAWAWLMHDPDFSPRSAFKRCIEEAKTLFLGYYETRYPKGIRLTRRKASIPVGYRPSSPSFQTTFYPDPSGSPVPSVGRGPTTRLREIADLCANELDAYSRWVLRQGDKPLDQVSGAALLPGKLFERSEVVLHFCKWLLEEYQKRGSQENVATIPFTLLRTAWRGDDSFTRGEALNLLTFMERIGWLVEPDLRFGGASLSTMKPEATVAIAPLPNDALPTPEQPARMVDFAVLALILQAAEKESLSMERLTGLIAHWPVTDEARRRRLLARLRFFCANPAEAKMPRKDAFAEILPAERARIADLIIAAAGQTVTPARTRELLKLFRLIGAEENDLYSRLHTMQTVAGSEDTLVSVRSGQKGTGFAIAAPSDSAPTIGVVRRTTKLDTDLLQQKKEETERVYQALAAIFEETPAPVTSPTPSVETAPAVNTAKTTTAKASPAILLQKVAEKVLWEKGAFAELARGAGWLPNAAYEAINDLAFEICGDALLSGDDPIEVMTDLLPELLENL